MRTVEEKTPPSEFFKPRLLQGLKPNTLFRDSIGPTNVVPLLQSLGELAAQ